MMHTNRSLWISFLLLFLIKKNLPLKHAVTFTVVRPNFTGASNYFNWNLYSETLCKGKKVLFADFAHD